MNTYRQDKKAIHYKIQDAENANGPKVACGSQWPAAPWARRLAHHRDVAFLRGDVQRSLAILVDRIDVDLCNRSQIPGVTVVRAEERVKTHNRISTRKNFSGP